MSSRPQQDMSVARVSDTIERSSPNWTLAPSRSSSSRGRAIKNGNPYCGELAGGFSAFHKESVDVLSRQDSSQKLHISGYGKRNFHEKFASSVFTNRYEEDIPKGPKNPDTQLVRPNSQARRYRPPGM